jgi:hypothetical protein
MYELLSEHILEYIQCQHGIRRRAMVHVTVAAKLR